MRKITLLALVALLIVAAGGCGDVSTGRLQGNVAYNIYDSTTSYNENAEHAKVTMTSPDLPMRYDYTDQSGNYLIEHIKPGTYTVVADYGEASNMPAGNMTYLFGQTQVDDSPTTYSTPVGTYPDASITVENVTIADDTTTTVNFMLIGY